MRTIHWLYLVTVALFVASLGLLVASARTGQQVNAVASVKQIMNGIVAPASKAVFNAVSTSITASGVEETAPKNDEEWAAVGNSAAALVESGNLLMIGSRVKDKGDWITMSRAMIDASTVALKAAQAKNPAAILESGEAIDASCDKCHQKYQKQP